MGIAFIDADDLHPAANIAKMRRGEALTDTDRQPWLDRVAIEIAHAATVDRSLVIACSALKRAYRDRLRAADPALLIVFLDASQEKLEARLKAREGHFMPASLVASQLATLERAGSDEHALTLDAERPVEKLVAQVVEVLGGKR
jgi:carbohydrate kinase (thermoresistant glucokinase family)